MKIKDIAYKKALNRILEGSPQKLHDCINPSQSFLILFDGTNESTIDEIVSFSDFLKKNKKTTKLLSYVDTKGGLIDFGMAVYNNSSLNWFGFPKDHIFKLLNTSEFDVLVNLNIDDKKHLHALACKANARFKFSLPTSHPHNFTLIIDTKEKNDIRGIIDEMIVYFDILAI